MRENTVMMPYDRYPEAIRAKVSHARTEANALQREMEEFGQNLQKDVVRELDDVRREIQVGLPWSHS